MIFKKLIMFTSYWHGVRKVLILHCHFWGCESLWLVIAGKVQVWLITLMMWLFHLGEPVSMSASQHAHYQGPDTGTAKCNTAMANVISHAWVWQVKISTMKKGYWIAIHREIFWVFVHPHSHTEKLSPLKNRPIKQICISVSTGFSTLWWSAATIIIITIIYRISNSLFLLFHWLII